LAFTSRPWQSDSCFGCSFERFTTSVTPLAKRRQKTSGPPRFRSRAPGTSNASLAKHTVSPFAVTAGSYAGALPGTAGTVFVTSARATAASVAFPVSSNSR
jgi:hypothetical protein